MKSSRIAALLVCIVTLLCMFCSCGSSNKMTSSLLFDNIDQDLLGKSIEEITEIDGYIEQYKAKEKDMDDGTLRLKYTYREIDGNGHGDAFVEGGKWFTTVSYFFRDGALETYRIEYRQSDFSQGMCAKRMELFSGYLTEKYGEPKRENEWEIRGGTLDMAKQNGGWILFVYEADE